jgi:hypothetical protein
MIGVCLPLFFFKPANRPRGLKTIHFGHIEDRKCRAHPDSGLNCLVGQLLLAVPQNLGKAYENSQEWLSY